MLSYVVVMIMFAIFALLFGVIAYLAAKVDCPLYSILFFVFMLIMLWGVIAAGTSERANCASPKTHCDGRNCRICGEANTDQASCCGQCGTKKSGTGRWQCVCEQWNTGNYCTACGKAKDCCSSSWTCDCGTQNNTEYCCTCGKKH